jgi:hypothetical protein
MEDQQNALLGLEAGGCVLCSGESCVPLFEWTTPDVPNEETESCGETMGYLHWNLQTHNRNEQHMHVIHEG